MQILDLRPLPPGSGYALARFDLQLPGGVRLFNLKLSRSPRGLRVHSAAAFGNSTATFTPDTAEAIKRLEYDRASAAVAEIDDVVVAIASEYALVRNRLLNIGSKVAPRERATRQDDDAGVRRVLGAVEETMERAGL